METTISVPTAKVAELAALAPAYFKHALTFEHIRDDAHRAEALEYVREVKALRTTRIGAIFERITKQAHELHKAIKGQWNDLDKPFEERETFVRVAIGRYDDQRAREAEAERQRVFAEQRKAELERQRLQAEADAAALKKAEDDRIAAAEKLESAGRADLAQRLIETPVQVAPVKIVAPPVPVYVAPPKPKGSVVTWKHRVTDFRLVPREYLMVDDRLLAQVARRDRDKALVPGVEFFPESSVAVRQSCADLSNDRS